MALVLFTELGPDLSRFPTAAQFASWLNLCPQNQITGGKRARLGTPQATTATAHKLARIIYHLITHRVAYDDSILAAEERQDLRRFERRLRRQARAIGYELVPEAA